MSKVSEQILSMLYNSALLIAKHVYVEKGLFLPVVNQPFVDKALCGTNDMHTDGAQRLSRSLSFLELFPPLPVHE